MGSGVGVFANAPPKKITSSEDAERLANTDCVDVMGIGHALILRINRTIFRTLTNRGWRVELVIPDQLPASWPNRLNREDASSEDPPIHILPIEGDSLRSWSFVGMTELLDARRPRIVYLQNEPTSSQAALLAKWCATTGAKLIINTNENDVPPILDALIHRNLKTVVRSLWKRMASRPVAAATAHVVAICEDGRKAMQACGFGERITVTPLGFDATRFHIDEQRRDQWRQRLGLTHPTVAYFGRLAPNKGIHLLIAALGRLKDLNWHFLIDDFDHASADYARQLRQAATDADLIERTISVNPTHEEIPDYMRAADIVVIPSTWREQYGRVAPEAMACGCAVVVSDIGALPELIGPCGIKVPAGNIDTLAEAIAALITDPDRRHQLGVAAAERAATLLSVNRQAELLDQIFHRVLAS